MALQLPERRTPPPPQNFNYAPVPIAQILAVQGQNPYAQTLDQLTPVISQALMARAQRKRQAQTNDMVTKSLGIDVPEGSDLSGLTPENLIAIKKERDAGEDTFTGFGLTEDKKNIIAMNKRGEAKLLPIPSFAPKDQKPAGQGGGYTIPRGVDPASGRPVYSDSKRIGLFYDDGKPFKGAPGLLNLKPLPSEQIQREMDLSSLQFSLDNVKQSYSPDLVGPVGARVGRGKQYLEGVATPEAASFYSNLADLRNQMLYLRSGKQINESEYNRLLQALPNENMSNTDFNTRMKNFESLFQKIKASRENALRGSGYRMPQPIPEAAPTAQPEAPGGWSSDKEARYQELLRKRGGR